MQAVPVQPVREITDRYRTERVLSSSGRLTVCDATDATSGARVVVELVAESRGATAGAAGRFLEAVAAMARLRHGSLPAVLDGGVTDDGAVFLVREPVDGRPFTTLGGESPGQILSLLLQVVSGLELLAGEAIHHGDLSLETLWVAAGSERPRAKILDLAPGVWRSRLNGSSAGGGRDDIRSLAAVACRLLGATVADPAAAEPRVVLPLSVAFELEDGDSLRALLERCLRRDPAARPADYREVKTGLCVALWGEDESQPAATSGASGAPPARLTFSTVPEDSLVAAPPPPAPPPRRRDEGEITKVVLPEELEGWEPEPAEDTGEVLSPIDFVPTGDETLTEPPPAEEPTPSPRRPVPAAWPPAGSEPDVPAAAVPDAPRGAAPGAAPPGAGPAHAPAAGQAAQAAPAAGAPAPKRRGALVAAALAAALLVFIGLGALAALWFFGRGGRDAAPGPAEPSAAASPAAPAAAGPLTVDPRLEAVLEHLGAGDVGEAQRALAAIGPEDQAAFGAAECELHGLLAASIDRAVEEQAAAALAAGLAAGDPARLRRGAAAVAGRERSFLARYPASAADLEQARRALAVLERARAAVAAGEPERVLEHAAALTEVFPAWEGALAMRESAAQTIESEADSLFEQGRYEAALDRLDTLAAAWPDREGLGRRRELVRTRLRAERDLGALLAAAAAAGEEGRPDEGLSLLAGVDPPARLAADLAETRGRLERRLAELDSQPPAIEMLAGSGPEYAKDEAALIVFRAGDDFRVERVTVHARTAGGEWQVLPGRRRGGDARSGEYAVEVSPDFHRNEPVEYYVTAVDPSGHHAAAGSADAPLELKRRRWFHRLLPN